MDELLDLGRDDPARPEGKRVRLEGALYRFEGPPHRVRDDAAFHPLRNEATGLVRTWAMLYPLDRGAPEYEERRAELATKSFLLLAKGMGAVAVPQAHVYEVPGGLLKLQPILDSRRASRAPERDEALFGRGVEAQRGGDLPGAVGLFEQVLAGNPGHPEAAMFRAACLAQLRRPREGLAALAAARELEPTEPDLVRTTAAVLLQIGRMAEAMRALDEGLARFPFDWALWRMRVEVALDYDLIRISQPELERMRALFPDSSELEGLVPRLEESQVRAARYAELLASAVELQRAGKWSDALPRLEEAMKVTRGDARARLNACVCHHHLGQAREVMGDLLGLIQELPPPECFSAALLALLAFEEAGDPGTAVNVAELLALQELDPWDLPTIPAAIGEGATHEDRVPNGIVEALARLAASPGRTPLETARLGALRKAYEERARLAVSGA